MMETQENNGADAAAFEDEKTIFLRKPVVLGKGDNKTEYAKLELREPTAGELEKASKATSQVGMVIALISQIAKVPRAVVEGLCQRDLKEASDFLGSFTEEDLTTGAMSSPS